MTIKHSPDDMIAAQRLHALLDYVDAMVRLDEHPAEELAQHRLADGYRFALHQHECVDLPEITLNLVDADGPIWLRANRLQPSPPPAAEEAICPWIEISSDPAVVPNIRQAVHVRASETDMARMVQIREVREEDCAPSIKATAKAELPRRYFDVMLRLVDRPAIVERIEAYMVGPWLDWSKSEAPRRRSIAVYQRIFETTQHFLQPGSQESLELVWGVGLARWSRQGREIEIPIVERVVEIEIADSTDASISIRPRALAARVDLRPFEKLAPEKFALAEEAANRTLRIIQTAHPEGVSPFVSESFEPILRICGSHLDPTSRYLPDFRSLGPSEPVPPAEGDALTVSNRFVIFARRTSANAVLRDIKRFKKVLAPEHAAPWVLDGAARTLVLGPCDGPSAEYQPLADNIATSKPPVSIVDGCVGRDRDNSDLFFPKPYNDDQVEIVRRLERADGVVVQGPPGTGKTHTIANIICHMLATGRRVLVVSKGETALRVIREQLPDGIRDLSINVTASDRDRFKHVEKAVDVILQIVNSVDGNPQHQRDLVLKLEHDVANLRRRLTQIDHRLSEIAAAHMSEVTGGEETPYERAQRILAESTRFDWFTDRPERSFAATQLDEEVISALATARQRVGADLAYLGGHLPSVEGLPAASTVVEWHRDLTAAANLADELAESEPVLRQLVTSLGSKGARGLADALRAHSVLVDAAQSETWPWALVEMCLSGSPVFKRIQSLAIEFMNDAAELVEQRTAFLVRPVSLPPELSLQVETRAILQALVAGRNPFCMLSFAAKFHRPMFARIRVSEAAPGSPTDWAHVACYVTFLEKVKELSRRWRSLRDGFAIPDNVDFESDNLARLEIITDALRVSLITIPKAFEKLESRLEPAMDGRAEARDILCSPVRSKKMAAEIMDYLAGIRLASARIRISDAATLFGEETADLFARAKTILADHVGNRELGAVQIGRAWSALLADFARLRDLQSAFAAIDEISTQIADAGSPKWAYLLRTEPATTDDDTILRADWRAGWDWAASVGHLERIGAVHELTRLHEERASVDAELRKTFARVVNERTFFQLAGNMRGTAKSALRIFADVIRKTGAGMGRRAALYRHDSRKAMENCYDAVPCWIMPSWRVSEQFPASFGVFDLVILDEASQSDIRELPALLRGKKILVVGDDRQVSPSAAFLSIAQIGRLRENYLSQFPYRVQVEPGASLYDLARVMFPTQYVMLKEHYRSVEPIIRFSMQFYNQALIPLRVSSAEERLDPPLVDILVEDGERRGKSKINPAEARVVVYEVEKVITDPALSHIGGDRERPRSIGVISLIGAEQAEFIQRRLIERIGETAMLRHRIVCGDSAALQGDARDIVFLSMVADRRHALSQTAPQYEQRFMVAMSRARDRLVLVRSVTEADLNPNDIKARVLAHFREPMPSTKPNASLINLCQSGFERDVFTALVERGYRVTPQVGSQGFSIDMVVEGEDGRRLAVECDGDRYHGPDRWANDMRRQRILERVGWTFWRCFGSNWGLDREGMLEDLKRNLERNGIRPVGASATAPRYTEHRMVRFADSVRYGESGSVLTASEESDQGTIDCCGEPPSPLVAGDRVAIRFLDDDDAKLECYVLTERRDDHLNGKLSLASPLASVLADTSPGDEIDATIDGVNRQLLFVSLERKANNSRARRNLSHAFRRSDE